MLILVQSAKTCCQLKNVVELVHVLIVIYSINKVLVFNNIFLFLKLLIKGADTLLLNLYKIHIKEKPILLTQKNTTTKEEMEVFEENNEELDEEEFSNCFTLTQSKNEDGLTFTECANESRVILVSYYIIIRVLKMLK